MGKHIQAKVSTNAGDLVKQAMKARSITQIMLANRLGYKGQNAISMTLNGHSMQVNVLAMMLDELGFDLIIKDRNSNNKENQWKVELISNE